MKKLFFTLLTSISLFSFSQAPQAISYQGVARNTSGTIISNAPLGIKLEILNGVSSVVYSETHVATTNQFGLFTLFIGQGTLINGTFSSINWGADTYFIKTSIDPAGGTSYTAVGTQQFMSVPYALYAQTAGNASSTPTITINAPNTVTSSGGSYTINVPASTSYTAGNGISISGGVISNTLVPVTPSITGGNNITINPASPSNSYTVSAPSYSLSQSGNSINLLQNGTSIGTATIPVATSYSAGSGISIVGNVISNTLTPLTPTLSVSGNSISINPGNTQALPNYSLTQSGANIDLTQNGTSIATVTLTAATSTSLSAGSSNILLNQSGNAYTITPVTPTFTNSGPTTITGSYPNYTVNSVASPTTSVVSTNTNISVSNAAGIYSLTAITPTLSGSGVIGAYPSYTINSTPNQTLSVNSGSLSISGGNTVPIPTTSVVSTNTNISVTSSAGVFSLTAVSSNLSGDVTGTVNSTTVNAIRGVNVSNTTPTNGQILQLVGGIWTPTTTIVPILSYTGSATAGTLQSGVQTVTIPNYTISNGANTNTITLNNGTASSTVVIAPPTLTLTGGSILQSGPATNTVDIKSINNWSVTTGVIYPSTLTNSVGVGINNSLGGRLGVSHTSSPASPHINIISPTLSDFGRVKFSNTGSSRYFSFEARNNTGGLADAFNIAHNNGIDEKQVFLINGNRNVFINNLNLPLAAFHVMTHSTTPNGLAVEGFNKFGELIIARNNQTGLSGSRQPIFATNEIGRITFSGASSTVYPNEYTGGSANISVRATDNFAPTTQGSEMYFQTVPTGTNVSKDVMKLTQDGSVEVTNMLRIPYGTIAAGNVLTSDNSGNASWQPITAPAAVWTSTLGNTYLVNSGDKVGIGTNTPSESLDVIGNINIPISTSSVGVIKMAGTRFISAPGTDNLFVGKSSGNISSTGFSNVALGNNTLQNITTGGNNVGIGYQVMQILTSGSQNIAIGTNALSSINSGNNNTALGFQAGNLITNGTNNLFLGYNTNVNAAALTNASAIGALARVDASNSMVLGSINGINGATANTKVGIGTTAPVSALDVVNVGNINAISASSSGTVETFSAKNTNASSTAYAGVFDGGLTTKGKSNTFNDYAFRAFNLGGISLLSIRDDAIAEFGTNVGINILNPANRLHVNSSYTNAAVYAENIVTGSFSGAHGIFGKVSSSNTNTLAAAVYGNNAGAGPSIYGIKNATDNGIAGRFEILNTSNTADAVFALTNGRGAAIHAVNGPTVTGSSNVALLLENGHMKSVGTTPTFTLNALASGTGVIGTDMVGKLSFTNITSPLIGNTTDVISVKYDKPYSITPNVIVIPNNSASFSVNAYVFSSTVNGFTLRFSNNGTLSTTYSFNYLVIE
jgi:hypothetical protein